jgi:curved DNA-binding protein CbpA
VPDDELDPYEILQVHPTAEHEVVKAAYRTLARRYHPDMSSSEESRRRMVAINRAWEVLGDPARRAELDRLRGIRAAGPSSSTPGASASASAPADRSSPPGAPTSPWTARHTTRPVNGWGAGAAGPPPGRPWGSVLDFGIYFGWSLGEVARVDPGYLDWLVERREGRCYAGEIASLKRRAEAAPPAPARGRRRLFGFG